MYTVDQYLAIDRASEERYTYFDGEIYAMAGESDAHGDITMNLAVLFGTQLKGTPCRVRAKDTKVRSGPTPTPGRNMTGLYSYPDHVVICGDLEYHDDRKDIVLNPKVIAEVLSESTEVFDRGEKFTRYQTWNPSLTDYILVSQDRPQVEHYRKLPDNTWHYQRHVGLTSTVTIESIICKLPLADIYDRVPFEIDRE